MLTGSHWWVLALDLSQPIKVRVVSDSEVVKEKFLNMLKLQGIFYEVKESIRLGVY